MVWYGMVQYSLTSHSTQYRSFWRQGLAICLHNKTITYNTLIFCYIGTVSMPKGSIPQKVHWTFITLFVTHFT